MEKLWFTSDYTEGMHPRILERVVSTNLCHTPGYGTDEICESAREKIRLCCGAPSAQVYFLVGGTQANATVLDAVLSSYQGVVAARTGHVAVHEAGAIEFGGHKVLEIPEREGKICPKELRHYLEGFFQDENRDHMVFPGAVYLSHPTEYGTLYRREELEEIHEICRKYQLTLYLDGARLAYGLACPQTDLSLQDLARLCDVFYIGGTKCGAALGEAVVIPDPQRLPHFFTIMKQHGALLAKGRFLGLAFDTLFTDQLYLEIGRTALDAAERLRRGLLEAGYEQAIASPTNQLFVKLSPRQYEELSKVCQMSFWERTADGQVVVRFATSWASREEDVEALIQELKRVAQEG